MDPEEYEALLIVAGLAHYTRFGFALKPMAWSKFLGLGGWGDENITINHGCGGGIVVAAATAMATAMAAAAAAMALMAETEKVTAALAGAAGAMTAMSDDDDNDDNDDDDNDEDEDDEDDDDDGYEDDGRQRWRRLPAPVPIDGAV